MIVEHVRKSRANLIRELFKVDENRVCPNCRSAGPFQMVHREECESYRCSCGQRWTEGFCLTYYPKVEYREEVGDMADPNVTTLL